MERLTSESIVKIYTQFGVIIDDLQVKEKYKKIKRERKKMTKICKYLEKNMDIAKNVLPILLKHENARVRSLAVSHCLSLEIYVDEAEKVLTGQIDKKIDISEKTSMGIDEIFDMLNCNNDIEIQKKGIEEGKKIINFCILFQPIETQEIWENCAKIIATKSDKILMNHSSLLFKWLQDENYPGYDIILNRIKLIPVDLMKLSYYYAIRDAIKYQNKKWLKNLSELLENKDLYDSLGKKYKKIIKNINKSREKSEFNVNRNR